MDRNSDGNYVVSDDDAHHWTHNLANEITEYTMSRPSGGSLIYTIPESFEYDDVGNLRRSDRSTGAPTKTYFEYVYDAWNRLESALQMMMGNRKTRGLS